MKLTTLTNSKYFRKSLLIVGVFLALALVSLFVKPSKAEAASGDPAQVYGYVTDQNGVPLANATVTLTMGPVIAPQWCGYWGQNGSWTYTTGASGLYSFGATSGNGLCCNASSITLRAAWGLYGSPTYSVSLSNGAATPKTLVITFPPPPSPPTASITANGTHGSISVNTGTSVTIAWTSTNATSCSVSPNGWTGVGGSQTITATTTTTYTETCTGPGGTGTDTVTVNVNAVDFSMSISPASRSVSPGGSTTYTVTLTSVNNWTGSVNLTKTLSGTGISSSLPTPVTVPASGSVISTLSVSTTAATPTGSYPISVTGTAGFLVHTVNATLVVTEPPSPDFSISISPVSRTISAGTSTTYTVTVFSLNGFSGSVNLSNTLSGTGISSSFSANPVSVPAGGSATSTINVSTQVTTPVATYPFTVTGTSGTLTHSVGASLVVTVVVGPDFAISVAPASISVSAGTGTFYTVTVTSVNNFSGSVNLSNTLAGSGIGKSFTANPITVPVGGSAISQINVTTQATTPVTSYPFTVTGTSGALTHSAAATLVVTAAIPDLAAISHDPITGTQVLQGSSVPFDAYVQNVGPGAANISKASIRLYFPDGTPIVTPNPTPISTPALGGLSAPYFLSWGASQWFVDPVLYPINPPATPYSYRVCVLPVAGETNFTNNCSPLVYFDVVSPASLAWVQTNLGNVGSMNSINFGHVATGGQKNGDYIAIARVSITNFKSVKNWLVFPYTGSSLPSCSDCPTNYSSLEKSFAGTATTLGVGTLPSAPGVYKYADGFTSTGSSGSFPGLCAVANKKSVVMFIDNKGGTTFTIKNPVFDFSCPTIIIASGSVSIDPTVDLVNAYIISDGDFTTTPLVPGPDNQIQINGGVVGALNGSSNVNLKRDLGASDNATEPAEIIELQPSYFWAATSNLGVARTYYKEENP